MSKTKKSEQNNIRIIGILHLLGGLFGGWGWLAVLCFYIIARQQFKTEDRKACYSVFNFSLSYFIWMAIATALVVVLIGLIAVPIIALMWFIFMIVGSISHMSGKVYKFPMTVEFFKVS